MRAIPKIPKAVENWWDATQEAARIRAVMFRLKKAGLSYPPDIVLDWDNALARVVALREAGAKEAARLWCETSGFKSMDPFLGAGAEPPEVKRGRDRGFQAFTGKAGSHGK